MSSAEAAGRALAARRRAAAYRRAAARRDLDPAKAKRDLAALDSATRRRVENYRKKTHL